MLSIFRQTVSTFGATLWKFPGDLCSNTGTSAISCTVIASQARFKVRKHAERPRTLKASPWWRTRRANMLNFTKDLTSDNIRFLKQSVEDTYAEVVSTASPLKEAPWPRGKWEDNPRTVRTGLLALKLGTCSQWLSSGRHVVATMLQVLDNHVVGYIPPEEFAKSPRYRSKYWGEGYACQVVGALSCDPHMFNPSYLDLFKRAGVPPKRKLTRFLITPNAAVQPGTQLHAAHFRPGDHINVQAKTIGHGFQGVVKRWKMAGGPATHGCTKSHRRIGSLAGPSMWGHVWKGVRMPGHMGVAWRTLRGIRVLRINPLYNVIYVEGPIPGPVHSYVRMFDSNLAKHYLAIKPENAPPMPTFYAGDPVPSTGASGDIYHSDLFQMDNPSIIFPPDPKERNIPKPASKAGKAKAVMKAPAAAQTKRAK